MAPDEARPADVDPEPTVPAMSPAWDLAVRAPDGVMEAAEPFRFEPRDWDETGTILTALVTATFQEATAWGVESDITINAEPVPGVPLDFLAVDIDGRHPWHAANATFMAPSGVVPDAAAATLRAAGWRGVGTVGPVYKVWDGVPLADVALQIAHVALAVFDPEVHPSWEFSVTVLAAEDDTGTYYEVAASATRAVIRRAVLTALGESTGDDATWAAACRGLGFDPADVPRVAAPAAPDDP